jgi:hypothetical protein
MAIPMITGQIIMILRCNDESPEKKEYPITTQSHGSQAEMGKVICDSLPRIMNIEKIRGITHAHPVIWRPKIGNSIDPAIKVDTKTIQTTKGRSIFLNFIDLKFMIFILRY